MKRAIGVILITVGFALIALGGGIIVCSVAHASTLPPWYFAPTLLRECDGLTISADCVTGTIVYFINEPPYGLVPQTQMLPATRWTPEPIVPPVAPIPVEAEVYPRVAAVVPEPSYFWFLVGVGAFLVLRISPWVRRAERWVRARLIPSDEDSI